MSAIYTLTKFGADEELAPLMKYLQYEPPVTWALHIALLDAAAKYHLPIPDISHLREVDNLDLQVAIAPFV